jgi:hypothetical protein
MELIDEPRTVLKCATLHVCVFAKLITFLRGNRRRINTVLKPEKADRRALIMSGNPEFPVFSDIERLPY